MKVLSKLKELSGTSSYSYILQGIVMIDFFCYNIFYKEQTFICQSSPVSARVLQLDAGDIQAAAAAKGPDWEEHGLV